MGYGICFQLFNRTPLRAFGNETDQNPLYMDPLQSDAFTITTTRSTITTNMSVRLSYSAAGSAQ